MTPSTSAGRNPLVKSIPLPRVPTLTTSPQDFRLLLKWSTGFPLSGKLFSLATHNSQFPYFVLILEHPSNTLPLSRCVYLLSSETF